MLAEDLLNGGGIVSNLPPCDLFLQNWQMPEQRGSAGINLQLSISKSNLGGTRSPLAADDCSVGKAVCCRIRHTRFVALHAQRETQPNYRSLPQTYTASGSGMSPDEICSATSSTPPTCHIHPLSCCHTRPGAGLGRGLGWAGGEKWLACDDTSLHHHPTRPALTRTWPSTPHILFPPRQKTLSPSIMPLTSCHIAERGCRAWEPPRERA